MCVSVCVGHHREIRIAIMTSQGNAVKTTYLIRQWWVKQRSKETHTHSQTRWMFGEYRMAPY